MKDRLEYLYAMHALSIHMQDKAALNDNDNPFIDEEDDVKPARSTTNTPTIVKKEEPISPKIEDDQQQLAAYSPQLQGGPSQLPENTTDDGPPLSSSPSNASPSTFHRHWKENIV